MKHFKELIKKAFLAAVVFLIAAAVGIPAGNMSPEGFWKTVDDETKEVESIVKLWVEKGELKGKIVKIFPKPGEDPDPVCDKCSGKLKNVRVIGMNFMWAFQKAKNKWINGKIVDPDNGKTYNCQLEITDSGKKMEVFGYIKLIFKIGRSQTWIRHEAEIAETSGETAP
ncbi:MAG: DUF2147 domain-containing protein [Candidatus Aminicenantes bacterium]|nr:DUF2147 domain-containing protein [Candidatus Aminicenantes bacterium]